MRNNGTFSAFSEGRLDEELGTRKRRLKLEIQKETDAYVLNVSEEQYLRYLVDKYRVEPPTIDFEHVRKKYYKNYKKGQRTIKYCLPVSGDVSMLRLRPSRFTGRPCELEIDDNHVCFGITVFDIDDTDKAAKEVERQAGEHTRALEENLGHLHQDIERYNNNLREHAEPIFRRRKETVFKEHALLAALDIPLRQKTDLPETYSVPSPKDRYGIIIEKPKVSEKGYEPDPTLNSEGYQVVLTIIHDMLTVLEQHPSLYHDKDEETLRDHILMQLTPRFDWSPVGEGFNRKGRTDILLRYQNANLFVAECKFWDGPKKYRDALDQLLRNLTWRDSKAAAIIFVRNKKITRVIETIKEQTPQHPNCLRFVDSPSESWLNYKFHTLGDPNKEVELAVLVAHLCDAEDKA